MTTWPEYAQADFTPKADAIIHLTDYEKQPFWVRVCRWLRWRPRYMLTGLRCILWWIAHGARPLVDLPYLHMTRWETIAHYWQLGTALADFKMGRCLTMEHAMENLKARQ